MRTFKIIVVTALLLLLVGGVLYGLKQILPNSLGPDEGEINELYHDESDHELGGDDIYAQTLKQYEGTIRPLGVSIYQEGTHRLENNGELVALLESEEVNLPDFEEKEVKVRGYVRDTVEGGQKIMDVRFLEQLKEAGVKLFNEVGYEWSFSYPADWKVEKEKDKVSFTQELGENSEKVMIVYQYPGVEDDFQTWVSDRDQNLFYDETQVKVGQGNGVRRTITNGDQQIVKTYTMAGDIAYELRLLSQDEVIKNQYFSIVDFFQTAFVDELSSSTDEEEPVEEAIPEDSNETTEEAAPSTEEVSEPLEENTGEPETAPEVVEEKEPVLPEEEPETSAVTNSGSQTVLHDLEPLTADTISAIESKGYTPFSGRTLIFDFPKAWYFSYLEGGNYGFTDGESYLESDEEVTMGNSRILLIAGKQSIECVSEASQSIGDVQYTVCAREPGLEKVIQSIASSIAEPAESE